MFSVANGLDAHEMAPNRLHPHCYASSNNLARRAEMAAHSLGMILAIFTGIIMQSSAGKTTGFVSTSLMDRAGMWHSALAKSSLPFHMVAFNSLCTDTTSVPREWTQTFWPQNTGRTAVPTYLSKLP